MFLALLGNFFTKFNEKGKTKSQFHYSLPGKGQSLHHMCFFCPDKGATFVHVCMSPLWKFFLFPLAKLWLIKPKGGQGDIRITTLEVTLSSATFRLRGRTSAVISCLTPCSSKCGPWGSSTGVTWKLIRDADARVPARPPESEAYLLTGLSLCLCSDPSRV